VNPRKYSVTSVGPRIDGFCVLVWSRRASAWSYEMADGEATDDDFETPDVVVKFSGPDVEYLLANRAELLLALEHVTMEALRMPSEDHSRISFDANDYRLLRIEELRLSAAAAAEKVKRTGQPFRFNPMNSRERRVIHLALRGETAAAQRKRAARAVSARGGLSGGHGQPADVPILRRRLLRGATDLPAADAGRLRTRSRRAPRQRRPSATPAAGPALGQLVEPHDTIVAISTPPGRGGLGVVRLSGAQAREIAARMVRFPGAAGLAALVMPTGSS
jgi:hypothetical protein